MNAQINRASCEKCIFYFKWQYTLNNMHISTVTSFVFHTNLKENGEIELFLSLYLLFCEEDENILVV